VLGTRIVPDGPDIRIEPSAAQTLGMGLHELATNPSKCGALSNDTGQVAIAWNCRSTAAGQRFETLWSESNGPNVHEPGRRGFGSTVLEDVIKGQFEANVALDYPATGVVWRIECPAGAV
jgi:two-component sensor histidine kinase